MTLLVLCRWVERHMHADGVDAAFRTNVSAVRLELIQPLSPTPPCMDFMEALNFSQCQTGGGGGGSNALQSGLREQEDHCSEHGHSPWQVNGRKAVALSKENAESQHWVGCTLSGLTWGDFCRSPLESRFSGERCRPWQGAA